ncbi:MAG: hypothetical protein LBG21_07430 [Campylobacteraceae bacterium]|jgi:acyl carrier protein|nr:hypothetical protein [Campylobacteraceae bacterium]
MKNRQEILAVINYLIKEEIYDKSNFKELTSEDSELKDTGLDSFDFIMVFLKLGEIYGINDKVFKEKLTDPNPNIKIIIDFLIENKTTYKTCKEIANER